MFLSTCSALTDGIQRNGGITEPGYAPLGYGEGSFCGTIYDESTVTDVKDLSFFGYTTLGGLRKEGGNIGGSRVFSRPPLVITHISKRAQVPVLGDAPGTGL